MMDSITEIDPRFLSQNLISIPPTDLFDSGGVTSARGPSRLRAQPLLKKHEKTLLSLLFFAPLLCASSSPKFRVFSS
jgi:hypothetical protein